MKCSSEIQDVIARITYANGVNCIHDLAVEAVLEVVKRRVQLAHLSSGV